MLSLNNELIWWFMVKGFLLVLGVYICLTLMSNVGRADKLPTATPKQAGKCEVGIGSWYGKPFHGRKTKSGEVYDMYKLTAASNSLPMGTIVEVTNLKNNKKVIVKINDTGAFTKKYKRLIDMSHEAAVQLDYRDNGIAEVKVCKI